MKETHLTARHYDLSLTLAPGRLAVVTNILVQNDGDRPAETVTLDLNPQSQVMEATDQRGAAAALETVPSPLCSLGTAHRLRFRTPLPPGAAERYRVAYVLDTFQPPDFCDDRGCCLRGQWESLWYPAPAAVEATFSIRLEAPSGWQPVLPAASPDGNDPLRWVIPVACPDLDLLAGPWRRHPVADGLDLYTTGQPDGLELVADVGQRAVEHYAAWFDRPAPRPFVIAELPDEVPAVVNVGLAALPHAIFLADNPYRTINLVSHEVAHTWWGGLVKQGDSDCAWLTEALAHYAQMRFVEAYLDIPVDQQLAAFAAQATDNPHLSTPLSRLQNNSPEEWTALRVKGTEFLCQLERLTNRDEVDKAIRRLACQDRFTLGGLYEAVGLPDNPALESLVNRWVVG